MGFEKKRRPTLLAIMDHHGLVLHDHENLSTEDMRNAIISHISQGDCVRSIPSSRPANSLHLQKIIATSGETSSNSNCEDFVNYVPMSDNDSDVRLKILTIALLKINSRNIVSKPDNDDHQLHILLSYHSQKHDARQSKTSYSNLSSCVSLKL